MTDQVVEEHPYSMCDSCGGVDRAPRHLHFVSPGDGRTPEDVVVKALANVEKLKDPALREQIVREALDQGSLNKHLDCCQADGCPDGSCDAIHAATPAPSDQPLQNEKLAKFITEPKNKVGDLGRKLNEERVAAANAAAEGSAE